MSEVWRLTTQMTLEANVMQNAWHVVVPDGSMTPAVLQDFSDGVLLKQREWTAAAITYEAIEYRRVDIEGTAGSTYVPTSWPLAGAQSGAYLPSYCALLVSGICSGQPRPNRIRKFVPGLLETWNDGSTFSSTGDTIRQNLVDDWQAYIDGVHTAEIVAVSYKDFATGVIEKSTGQRWNLVTDVKSSDLLAIMGSRKLGRGI